MASPSIVDRLLRRAEATPDDPFAYVQAERQTTAIAAADLVDEAGRWARLLVEDGCRPGDVVILVLRHGPELYTAFLGCVLAGCVPSFMPFLTPKQDPRLYWQSHDALFRRIRAACIVTWTENAALLRDMIPDLPYRVRVIGEQVGLPPLPPRRLAGGEEPALLQHSSGTTSLKKGVALSHGAIIRQVESYSGQLGLARGDVIASWLPLYHDMGLIACFMAPLLTDTTVVSLDAFEWVARPQILLAAIAAHRAHWCWLPNFAFAHLARTRRPGEHFDLSSVRAFINCSEPCKAETFDQFRTTFADCGVTATQLQTCYAMAETVFAVTQSGLDRPVGRIALSPVALAEEQILPPRQGETPTTVVSVGLAIPGIAVRILDSADQPLPDDRIGQVAVTGQFLFSGYYALPDETAAAFVGEWYRTGDLGFTRNGELYITGRLKDVIIVHGKNLYAHDIEAVANRIDGVKAGRAVAVGAFNPNMGSEDLVLICETTLEDPTARRDLRRAVRTTIEAHYGLPGVVAHVTDPGWLVKTTSGKISRKENLAKFMRETARG